MFRWFVFAPVYLILALAVTPIPAVAEPRLIGLGIPDGATSSEVLDLSGDGCVAVARTVQWRDGLLEALTVGPFSTHGPAADVVSYDGSISAGSTGYWAFGRSGDGVHTRPAIELPVVSVTGISADGFVAVGSAGPEETVGLGRTVGWRWEEGMLELFDEPQSAWLGIAAVSGDGATVAGWEDDRVFVERDGVRTHITSGRPTAVSADASTVVGYSDASLTQAFHWANGKLTELGDLPTGDLGSRALDVTADGSRVVGQGSEHGPVYPKVAFLWDAENGMRKLRSVLRDEFGLDVDRWILESAVAISDDGRTIVGNGLYFAEGDSSPPRREAWLAVLEDGPPCPESPTALEPDLVAPPRGDS